MRMGRYGPYVKYGKKYVSIPQDDPHTISLERALEVIEEQRQRDANKVIQDFEEQGIRVLNGRYGPYITDGNKNVKIPKDREPADLTLQECQDLIAAAPAKKARARKSAKGARRKAPAKRAKAR